MKYCYARCKKEGTVRFHKNSARLKLWIEALEITDIPAEHHRVCSGHFQSCDFTVKQGRKFLDVHAVPSKHVYPETSVISLSDHNYAQGMTYGDVIFPPEILILLLFSLLLLFEYFLTKSEPNSLPTKTVKSQGSYLYWVKQFCCLFHFKLAQKRLFLKQILQT